MKIYCMFSLESPHQGDSNVYTQYTIIMIEKKIAPDYSKSAAMGFFFLELKNEFETAVLNEPPVFEPLKFCCTFDVNRFNQAMTHFISVRLTSFERHTSVLISKSRDTK